MRKTPSINQLFDWEYQWTKGSSSRNSLNEPVETYNEAICWCLAGRLEHLFGIKGLSNLSPIVIRIAAEIRAWFPERVTFNPDLVFDIIAFNDHAETTFNDVQFVVNTSLVDLSRKKVMA